MEKILIICNGTQENAAFLQKQAAEAKLIVCADGGANTALLAGITPHVVIGDLDSVSPAARAAFTNALWFHQTRQDNTDFEKALEYCLSKNIEDIVVACAFGGRVDFSISNFLSAFNYINRKNIIFKGHGWRVYLAENSRAYPAAPGKKVSIIPLMGDVHGLTLNGLKYQLTNALLRASEPAVSNVAENNTFEVKFEEGRLLVYVED